MKKIQLTERFQQLAGIKPLYEQDDEDLRLEPEDGEYVDEIELEDLDFETLKASFPKFYQKVKFTRPQTGEPYYEDAISFPNLDDSSMVIGDKLALKIGKTKYLDDLEMLQWNLMMKQKILWTEYLYILMILMMQEMDLLEEKCQLCKKTKN